VEWERKGIGIAAIWRGGGVACASGERAGIGSAEEEEKKLTAGGKIAPTALFER